MCSKHSKHAFCVLRCSDVISYDPFIAQFTVAWFKVFLDKTFTSDGVDWYEMIFGRGR